MEHSRRWLWLAGWGPVLPIDSSTPTSDVVAFVAHGHLAAGRPGRPALGTAPMWPWQRRALLARVRAAGVEVRSFSRAEERALQRTNRLPVGQWWRLTLLVPIFAIASVSSLLGRGRKVFAAELMRDAPPDAGDRVPRPTAPSPLTTAATHGPA